jgi:hypothetical protein
LHLCDLARHNGQRGDAAREEQDRDAFCALVKKQYLHGNIYHLDAKKSARTRPGAFPGSRIIELISRRKPIVFPRRAMQGAAQKLQINQIYLMPIFVQTYGR